MEAVAINWMWNTTLGIVLILVLVGIFVYCCRDIRRERIKLDKEDQQRESPYCFNAIKAG